MPAYAAEEERRRRVSIRARHCWRAMPSPSEARPVTLMFQSAPAIAGGRCSRPACRPALSARFNPRPPLLAGDARRCREVDDKSKVSIRARHCWRAMRKRARRPGRKSPFQSAPAIAGGRCLPPDSWVAAALSFNPRPPLLAGDAFHLRNLAQAHDVSIRARHCWRAMLPCTTQRAHSAGFQSAPAIAGGRCMPGACATPWHKCFNPRPPLLAGDACSRRSTPRPIWCFNPRPPLLAGDASRPAPTTRAARSFNPRPPLLAGDA